MEVRIPFPSILKGGTDMIAHYRGHVAYDIQPYTCIYDDCAQEMELFTKREAWVNHMKKNHSITRWFCDICSPEGGGASTTPVFSSDIEWIVHMRLSHCDVPEYQDLTINDAPRRAFQTLEPVACPLCPAGTEPLHIVRDPHIALHLHDFALRSLSLDEIAFLDGTILQSTPVASEKLGLNWEEEVVPEGGDVGNLNDFDSDEDDTRVEESV